MGLAIGAVIIRQDIKKFNDDKIIKHFFGDSYTELLEKDLYGSGFDIRKDDCIAIYKMPNLIVISNYAFTAQFYQTGALINQVYDYFKHPAQIFAFENYDSGGLYSYSLINRGKLVRWVRQTVDDIHPKTYGTPLNIEQKILQAKKVSKAESDGVTYTYFTHPDTHQLFEQSEIGIMLLREVMHHEVNVYPETLWDKATNRRYFRLNK